MGSRPKSEGRRDQPELSSRATFISCDSGRDRRREEQPTSSVLFAAGDDLSTHCTCVGDVLLHLGDGLLVDVWSDRHALLRAVSYIEVADAISPAPPRRHHGYRTYVEPVGAQAGLPGITELRTSTASRLRWQRPGRVVEDDGASPPSSRPSFLIWSEAYRIRVRPICVEPVNVILRTLSFS